jgi:hypothetical protein
MSAAAGHSPPQLASLVAAVKAQAAEHRDYLQRQLIVATRAIASGQELLLHYSRDDEPAPSRAAAMSGSSASHGAPSQPTSRA